MSIIFVDTETTGLGASDRIVQIAWVVHTLDGYQVKSENHVIKPVGFEIPQKATAIHGITTQEAIDGGEDLDMVLRRFMEDSLKSSLIVGHNISFDVRMIDQEFPRIGSAYNLNLIEKCCTMYKSKIYCSIPTDKRGWKNPNLKELYKKLFNTGFENAHDAMGDVKATLKCYYKLRELGVIF